MVGIRLLRAFYEHFMCACPLLNAIVYISSIKLLMVFFLLMAVLKILHLILSLLFAVVVFVVVLQWLVDINAMYTFMVTMFASSSATSLNFSYNISSCCIISTRKSKNWPNFSTFWPSKFDWPPTCYLDCPVWNFRKKKWDIKYIIKIYSRVKILVSPTSIGTCSICQEVS